MPDVFSPTWVKTQTNIRPAGAASLLVKIGADAAYYDLGAPRDVKLNGKSLFKPDTFLRPLGWGLHNDMMVPTIQASVTELKILDNLILSPLVGFQIKQLDSLYFVDTTPIHGLRWKIHSKGDFDDFRMIEYTFAGNIKKSEWNGLWTTTPVTIGTPDAADKLFTLAQTHVFGNQVPNGLTKVEFKASGDAAYADLGEFNKGTWMFECVGPLSGGARGLPRTTSIKFTFDVHGLQTGLVEMQLMDDIVNQSIDLKLTHADGMVITLSNTSFGTQPSFVNDGNDDKDRGIDLHAEGTFIVNAAGTAFVDGAGTTWDSIFS